jgi:hypothetical protein
VEYLDGTGVKWAKILGLNWGGKGWRIWLELQPNRLDRWTGIFEWSWGQKS